MKQNAVTESNQEEIPLDNQDQEAGVSVLNIVDFLRVRALQLIVIAVITGMFAVGIGYFVKISERSLKIATYEFAFTFDGAAENKYPNGIPFSPQDVLAAPVLDQVYATMHLKGKMDLSAFRSTFTIARGGTELRLLQSDFEQKLGNTKLTAAERTPLEVQYRAALATLKSDGYILTGDFTNIKLSDLEIERILAAIPAAWAEFAQKTRGVATYDISVPTTNDADKFTSETDYLIAAETLRSVSIRTTTCVETLLKEPGAKVARDAAGKGLDDLGAEVAASYRVDVLPNYTNFIRLAYAQDAARVNEVFSNRIATSERAVESAEAEAQMTTETFRNYIILSSGGNMSSGTTDAERGQIGAGTSNMPVINLNADFFDRIIGQGIAAKDTDYRQKLNDLQLKTHLKVLQLKDVLAFDQWLLKQIQPDTRGADNSPVQADGSQVGGAQANNSLGAPALSVQATLLAAQGVQDRLAKFAARSREFYDLLSTRNLNASTVLYSSQSAPMVFQTNTITFKQIATATAAAEAIVLGASLVLMTSLKRRKPHQVANRAA